MFRGDSGIRPLVDLLLAREASLWHACQLVDYGAYLTVGGIPSRRLLEARRLPVTPFETDKQDRVNQVWDRVFLNLSDFGTMFWSGRRAVPNPFGPITFQLKPSTLLRAADVALCLRSAGARDFDLNQEALRSVNEVDRIFVHGDGALFPESAMVKYGHQLQESFEEYGDTARSCEISAAVDSSLLRFDDVVAVWVDPVAIGGVALIDRVRADAERLGHRWRIHTRTTAEARRGVYKELLDIVEEQEHMPLRLLGSRHGASAALKDWVDGVLERDLEWQYHRWHKYLRSGTVLPLRPPLVAPLGQGRDAVPRPRPQVRSQ